LIFQTFRLSDESSKPEARTEMQDEVFEELD
jgi:hypothetical protein